jgi:hypothetical protein
MTRYLLLFDSYGLVFVGRPLWREDGSVFCICCWPSPGSLSRVRVPWDSWPYFTVSDLSLSLSHIATDGQSVCLSWYRAPSGVHYQILVTFWQFLFCPLCGPHRKHPRFHCNCIVVCVYSARTCLPSRCINPLFYGYGRVCSPLSSGFIPHKIRIIQSNLEVYFHVGLHKFTIFVLYQRHQDI